MTSRHSFKKKIENTDTNRNGTITELHVNNGKIMILFYRTSNSTKIHLLIKMSEFSIKNFDSF